MTLCDMAYFMGQHGGEFRLGRCGDKMDAYTKAHLSESQSRIEKALQAGYVYNGGSQQPMRLMLMMSDEDKQSPLDQ